MIELFIYFAVYLLAGLTLKAGDDLLDVLDRPSQAWIPLTLSGFMFGLLMAYSQWDLVLLTAIIIGVLLSGKVNQSQFVAGFVMIGLVVILRGLPTIDNPLGWLSLLIMLFLAAILDERGNDWTDSHATPNAARFFQYRLVLKVSALLLVIPWPEFLFSALGLWVFDFGYELAGAIVKRSAT